MVEAPEKIYAGDAFGSALWDIRSFPNSTEYTRSDIAERQIAELQAERDALQEESAKRGNMCIERNQTAIQLAYALESAEAENARLSEANRKLHRRAQGAEGLLQNASNVAREQIETLESVATKAGHWPAGSHWAKRAMERWLESVLSDSTQPALPLKDEVERPDFWAVQSKTGMHIGLWTDRADADEAMHEYEGGTIMPLFRSSILSRLRAGEQEGWQQYGWAYQDKQWDEGRWHVCGMDSTPRERNGRLVQPIYVAAAPSEQGGDRG